MPYAVDIQAIHAASERIAGRAHRTPVLVCATLDRLVGRQVFFKCENLQRVGAFKFRGALNAVMHLSDTDAARGVVTHSSGNHAQALALAAATRGIPATIVMPTTAPAVKRAAVAGYGARIVDCAPTLADREWTAAAVVAETGGTLIHPYDHPDVIAGQGTAALELHDAVPDLDAVIAPVGGGGLISGTAVATRAVAPRCAVFAAEPTGADDAARGKATGARVLAHTPRTVADGLLTTLGELTWPIVRDQVDEVLTVDDDAILAAMRMVFERMKLVIEPSAAVPVAVALSTAFRERPGLARIGIVISGGNVDLKRFFDGYPRP